MLFLSQERRVQESLRFRFLYWLRQTNASKTSSAIEMRDTESARIPACNATRLRLSSSINLSDLLRLSQSLIALGELGISVSLSYWSTPFTGILGSLVVAKFYLLALLSASTPFTVLYIWLRFNNLLGLGDWVYDAKAQHLEIANLFAWSFAALAMLYFLKPGEDSERVISLGFLKFGEDREQVIPLGFLIASAVLAVTEW